MRIRGKLRLIIVIASAGLVAVTVYCLLNQRTLILAEKQAKTRDLIDAGYSVLTRSHELETEGKLTRAEAQTQALEVIRTLRYDQSNYFWINDMRPVMIMHPTNPKLDGMDLNDFKDPTGELPFVEMVKKVREKGAGFVYYMWPRPGSDTPVPKLSYVKEFAPWGWVIGTGIYIDDVNRTWFATVRRAGGLAAACLLLLFVLSFTLANSIARRLGDIVERIKDVAEGEGDLTKRISSDTADEIGELVDWFNAFMDKLQEIISRVADTTNHLASASAQLSATASQQSDGAETQKGQTNNVMTSMQQMSATVSEISRGASEAAAAARKASQTAHEGGAIFEEALDVMRKIAGSVGQTALKIQGLGKRSDQIGEIIGVIDEIADQTNMLALNAAIEAARAGEQGRGFAVVADEVRKLSERTTKATKEISAMILSIQQETHTAVQAMEAGTKQVGAGVERTSTAGGSLREIIQSAESVGSMVTRIAAAASQQSSATEEINGNVEQIAGIARETASGATESAKASHDLSLLALSLQGIVGHFKLNNEDGSEVRGSVSGKSLPASQLSSNDESEYALTGTGRR
jgi:methyl-accepting chemotaxis protein